jgi:hypothetical protein
MSSSDSAFFVAPATARSCSTSRISRILASRRFPAAPNLTSSNRPIPSRTPSRKHFCSPVRDHVSGPTIPRLSCRACVVSPRTGSSPPRTLPPTPPAAASSSRSGGITAAPHRPSAPARTSPESGAAPSAAVPERSAWSEVPSAAPVLPRRTGWPRPPAPPRDRDSPAASPPGSAGPAGSPKFRGRASPAGPGEVDRCRRPSLLRRLPPVERHLALEPRRHGRRQGARVRDIYPGGGSSTPLNLAAVAGALYFAAFDPMHGYELGRSFVPVTSALLGHGSTSGREGETLVASGGDSSVIGDTGPAGRSVALGSAAMPTTESPGPARLSRLRRPLPATGSPALPHGGRRTHVRATVLAELFARYPAAPKGGLLDLFAEELCARAERLE